MKTTLLTFTILLSILSFSQESNVDSNKELYFYTNLKDRNNKQLLHAEIKIENSYAITGHITNGSNFLGLGRYKIERMKFDLEEIEFKNHRIVIKPKDSTSFLINKSNEKNIVIQKIKFKCFVKNVKDDCTDSSTTKQPRKKKVAKFEVHIGLNNEERISNIIDKDISVFDDAILDFKIVLDDKVKELFNESSYEICEKPSEKKEPLEKDKRNFGGHICRSRVAY